MQTTTTFYCSRNLIEVGPALFCSPPSSIKNEHLFSQLKIIYTDKPGSLSGKYAEQHSYATFGQSPNNYYVHSLFVINFLSINEYWYCGNTHFLSNEKVSLFLNTQSQTLKIYCSETTPTFKLKRNFVPV